VPGPANLGDFVKDKAAAIRLGKALFWDMQVGSDGIQACASCHFHAGADSRVKNQLDPGLRAVPPDLNFTAPHSPNHTLTIDEFPFHKLADVNDRNSAVLADSNDVVSSQGIFSHLFADVLRGSSQDIGILNPDLFNVGGIITRRVEPRNTPSMINAVFNFRNFWDGRAQNHFNGVSPFGDRDPNAQVFKAVAPNTLVQAVRVSLENSSLASQAVGPPGSNFESSFAGRDFFKIGKKVCALMPLKKQSVDPNDSVLGIIARSGLNPAYKGLTKSYQQMIREAFQPQWWNSTYIITGVAGGPAQILPAPNRMLTTNEYTLMEANFSLIWGLAIQCYEATLVSDQTPFDQFAAGNTNALSAQEQMGMALFTGTGHCITCHGGAELTHASVSNVQDVRLERMTMGNDQLAVYDNGFYNIGVRPTLDDLGIGATDPFGNPLSESAMAQAGQFFDPNLSPPMDPTERIAVMGSFKTPSLRNVELTGPYFHNGGQATLMQVVEFYNRGSDFGLQNIDNFDVNVVPRGFTLEEKQALVAFLKALTDPRVKYEQAPFDHPQIFVPNGEKGDQTAVLDDGTGQAVDDMLEIPAVGATGGAGIGPTFPQ
jgi:cytochrome c peroxidase